MNSMFFANLTVEAQTGLQMWHVASSLAVFCYVRVLSKAKHVWGFSPAPMLCVGKAKALCPKAESQIVPLESGSPCILPQIRKKKLSHWFTERRSGSYFLLKSPIHMVMRIYHRNEIQSQGTILSRKSLRSTLLLMLGCIISLWLRHKGKGEN